ncbi:NAD(P)/FAD-dependent oxidoreductase [Pseudomonas aeruginosa]|uniref:NAD(P)/FAD-dependent oxidoreductase n=1 Tax=Pseudomonas aeruginosa TaxID=287 RepID=UPI0003BB365D|nr:NAD(P)/FAD-dependent oxidoreductase [Pseudomonas aeruginosa]AJD59096.1 FAD-dependent oxidoreductase [Pseudomonas aeruginosa]EKX9353829.1 NAD(P)/FAD-dependent oxidoreductase [Pseudomonas aeruginosa]ERZ26596.1 oxidoreductase [Pseudomonas aeruginosa CF27]KLI77303.1 FAD-dependent oxidoreductase [Pseudomonas aeruginosa]KZE20532.1 FAD/NAD(P)-binding oxidoreductase [Pseudomonas aeruginosa]
MTEPLATKTAIFDVAVIGAGVVGCAMARRFALEGARVVLLEKSTDILSGASKGNSAILHTGFDAPPGSIELACMQEGYREYRDIHARLNLPLLETGALVAAWSDEDLARLPAIVEQAHGNGVDDVRQVGRDEVLALEPQLAGNVLGAVRVPGEHLVDPWSAPLAYLQQALAHGAEACFDVEVLDGAFDGGEWVLHTRRGDLRARQVINCAGLFGDQLEQRLLGAASFAIHPRKGQFVVFDKAAAALLRHILLPVPNERTKGVVFTRTVFGNLLAGPTAEEQDDREQARVDSDTLQRLIDAAVERIPGLRGMPVTATYAGLRPASEKKEYRIRRVDGRNWISVGGIRSTGLTAALGIARHVYRLYQGERFHEAVREPLWPQVPNLAEHLPRDWQRPGYDEIVCHCEMVTRREILAALEGPLPAGDFGGLKRRTRACMGRCQGFYCNARVAELSAGRLAQPLATGSCHEHH